MVVEVSVGLLFVLMISSVGVYAILLSGWSSHSKYSFIGALRAAAQMISYEVSLGLIIMVVVICSGSLNIVEIVRSQEFSSAYLYFL